MLRSFRRRQSQIFIGCQRGHTEQDDWAGAQQRDLLVMHIDHETPDAGLCAWGQRGIHSVAFR